MRIAIYGYGFIGSAYSALLRPIHDVCSIDPAKGMLKRENWEPQGVIIAVPAPTVNGKVDVSIINDIIGQYDVDTAIMIKSTIPPDYAEGLPRNVTYSPEFLRAETAKADVLLEKKIILGGGYHSFWTDVFHYVRAVVVETDARTASFMKYAINTFLATKLSFMVQLAELYGKTNWNELKELIAIDPRIGDSHMDVPGTDGKMGWSGYCFPKDVDAFLNFGYNQLSVLSAANEANRVHRQK